ncbi:hypothetical protein F4561_004113 [Lipingzhangella halophila]|uniref:Uncharacterized protein n=1 Tax=Lipingzhangella halophila TaxID=1783352 RepID=A0A7W7RKK6_9ACTN|nr:hypothetical protein [Lipingzhangella halophila]MBB4933293.1 hypothetical protein [Lipingzhangella halophila]
MAEVHATVASGGTPKRAEVRPLWFALRDTETDRVFTRLRYVYPQWHGGTLRCAFSERPRRWARKSAVTTYIAPTVLEQEALAALVQAAGFGHPAADARDGDSVPTPAAAAHGCATESGAVPTSDIAGRVTIDARREAPLVSVSTGDYLLRKLKEQALPPVPERTWTADQLRRVRLGEELAEMCGTELAQRLSGILLRLEERMPHHFWLLEQARGRASGAPYRPVGSGTPDAVPPPGEPLARFSRKERAWLSRTVASLRSHARRHPSYYRGDPGAVLDHFLTTHLCDHPSAVPKRWAAAPTLAETRADLLDALVTIAEEEEVGGGGT